MAAAVNYLAEIIKPAVLQRHTLPDMKRRTAKINIRVEPRLVEEIEAWRSRQRVLPSRTAAIVYMIEQFLVRDDPPLP